MSRDGSGIRAPRRRFDRIASAFSPASAAPTSTTAESSSTDQDDEKHHDHHDGGPVRHRHPQCPDPGVAVADSLTVSALPDSGYVIGEQDVLNVTVWDNAELTGKYSVQPGGDVTIPVVGRVKAAGLSVGAFETALTRALADGFIRDPRVAVTLDQYRGKRIFVFGNVTSPGTYPLPEGQTLIEALVRAGYAAASEAVIVRPKHATGPVMIEDAGDAEVLRVNL
jgi:polysaccharide export outer membrane protein